MKKFLLSTLLCLLAFIFNGQGLPDSVYVSRNKNKYTFTYRNEQIKFHELLAYSRVNDDAYKALLKARNNFYFGIDLVILGVITPIALYANPANEDIDPEIVGRLAVFGGVITLFAIPIMKSAHKHIDNGITILNSNVMKKTGALKKPTLELGMTQHGIGFTLHF